MNMNNYNFLLSDLSKLKGVGNKTAEILKKKNLKIYLIYYLNFHSHILTEVKD